MAISSKSEDKFAFLFTGSAEPQYIADIRKVLETLIKFYGYLPENIDVIAGEDVPDFVVPDPPDPTNIFHTAGLTSQVLTGSDELSIKADLQTKLEAFFIDPTTPVTPGFRNCSFFYFTGIGSVVTSPTTNYHLEIAKIGITPVTITQSWLTQKFNFYPDFLDNNHVNILMQQSKSYGFWEGAAGLNNIASVDTQLSFTAACNSLENIVANGIGSEFTDYWTDALQLVPRGTTYADQESTDTTSPEAITNLLVSMKKAFVYADTLAGLTPKYEFKGLSEQYIGLPAFLIRDGDQVSPPEPWWESPDIFLTHPPDTTPDDFYHPDEPNEVNIRVFNSGTHPVRKFSIGSIIFLSGGGGVGDSVVSINPVFLKPGESYLHTYTYNFGGTETHRCARAKAQLDDILLEQINENGINDVSWFVDDHDNEAQRNLDQLVVKKSNSAPAEPDTAVVDENNAGEAAEPLPPTDPEYPAGGIPEDEQGARSLHNLRGLKEHIYVVRNIFSKTHKYIIPFPEDYLRLRKIFRIEWFEIPDKKNAEPVRIKIIQKPEPHIKFTLDKGEQKKLLFYLAVLPKVTFNGNLKLPFEIMVDTKPVKEGIVRTLNRRGIDIKVPDYLSFAGLTVTVKLARRSDIYGKVVSRSEKPVAKMLVFISTINGRQSAVVRTDERGYFMAPWIDPDIYKLWVCTKEGNSKPVIVILKDGSKQRIDLKEK
jgi:hypothetical protein